MKLYLTIGITIVCNVFCVAQLSASELESRAQADKSLTDLLNTEKYCHALSYNELPSRNTHPGCLNRVFTGLNEIKDPLSSKALSETLDWYWARKSRFFANEVIQRHLFNHLQSPIFDAILMEKRFLQSITDYARIQFRVNAYTKKTVVSSHRQLDEKDQSIDELFQLTYDIPDGPRTPRRGYIHQDRLYGSAVRMMDHRTEMNRLIGNILLSIGTDSYGFDYRGRSIRSTEAKIPELPAFWETIDKEILAVSVRGRMRWRELVTSLESTLKQLSDVYKQWLKLNLNVNLISQLNSDKIFIEYVKYHNYKTKQDHYAAFTLSTSDSLSTVNYSDLGPALKINQLINRLRRGILTKSSIEKEQGQLTDLLLKPLSTHFPHTKEFVISPTTTLNTLPFSLLLNTTEASDAVISYSDSWSILIQYFLREAGLNQQPTSTPGIVLADPDFGGDLQTIAPDLNVAGLERNSNSDTWPRYFTPLTYTAEEAKTIKRLSPDKVSVFMGKEASEFALYERNNPKFIHIASHGYFLSDDWQHSDNEEGRYYVLGEPRVLTNYNSGLALKGANQLVGGKHVEPFQPDGLFTVADAASLNLIGTELVVLSACNTGQQVEQYMEGRIASVGDGVNSLRAAFRQAGAKNVIMSLWPVADKTTWWLMEEFYRAWFSGVSPKQALGLAKSRLRERLRKNAMSDHPYYWAGFVIQSEF